MAKRKSLGKKVRFEVFKRDSFTCQYCGGKPPGSVLQCDHINPVAKGGENDIDNLITACFDCNSGKSDRLLTDLPKSVKDKAELIEEKELQLKEYNKLLKKIRTRVTREINKIDDIFAEYFPDRELSENFREATLRTQFLAKLSFADVQDAMRMACDRKHNSRDAVKYFCGICWNWIKGGR